MSTLNKIFNFDERLINQCIIDDIKIEKYEILKDSSFVSYEINIKYNDTNIILMAKNLFELRKIQNRLEIHFAERHSTSSFCISLIRADESLSEFMSKN